jgi:hypothetical protein
MPHASPIQLCLITSQNILPIRVHAEGELLWDDLERSVAIINTTADFVCEFQMLGYSPRSTEQDNGDCDRRPRRSPEPALHPDMQAWALGIGVLKTPTLPCSQYQQRVL